MMVGWFLNGDEVFCYGGVWFMIGVSYFWFFGWVGCG